MNQYVDASVILRLVLREPMALTEWKSFRHPASSALVQVECLRTIDRLQFTKELKEHEAPRAYAALHDVMGTVNLLRVGEDIIESAGGPFGLPLKTLDGLHLVTAIAWRQRLGEEVTFVTHDGQLARAARSYHFPVLGA